MFSGVGVQTVIRVIVVVVLARLLTPADFGLVAAALVVVSFSQIFSMLGVGPTIVQRPNIEDGHLRTGFTISVLFATLLAGMIWLLAPGIGDFFRMKELTHVLRVIILVFPLQGISVVAESLLRRELRFRSLAGIEVVSFAVGFGVVGVSLALMNFGVWALVWAQLAQAGLSSIILLVIQPHPAWPKFERRAFNELMFFGAGFTAARVCNYFALYSDNIIVGRWLGADALGLYGRAYSLMTMSVTLFGRVLDKVLFPAMAKVQKERKRLATAYRRGIALVALVVLPMSAVAYVLAPELIDLLLGSAWVKVIVPFQILTIGMLFRVGHKISGPLARATGAVYRNAWRQAVYAVLVVGGAWIGQHWGISGVAFGVLAAIAIHFILMAQLSLTLIGMKWRTFLTAHLPGITLAAIVYLEVWAVAMVLRGFSAPSIIVLIISVVVAAITLLVLLLLTPKFVLGRDGLWMLQTVVEYIPGKFIIFSWMKRGIETIINSV